MLLVVVAMAVCGGSMATTYVFDGDTEAERLRILAEVTAPATRELLQRAGVTWGIRCLDVGCGTGAVTQAIAELVGPSGRVVGLDINPEAIASAKRRWGATAGLTFRVGGWEELPTADSRSDEQERFDIVYTRFLLTHVRDPRQTIETLIRQLRPGGVLIAEDIDFDGHFAFPRSAAFDRFLELYKAAVTKLDGDPCIGPKLLGFFQDAGLEGVDQSVQLPTFHAGPGKTLARLALLGIRSKLLELALATEPEIDQLVASLEQFEKPRRSMNSIPRIHQVWGRRVSGE
jgi:2-polyprenyl-3-methyl-5-hydroxy-6-metoxy-1,4-benzoquinol methylase